MEKQDFMRVVMHPSTKVIGVRPVTEEGTKFRRYQEDIVLDRLPNIILSSIKDTSQEVGARIDRRMEVLNLVFGEAKDSKNISKFEWHMTDEYVRPSNEILMEVVDAFKSTLMFLAYRNWQKACGPDDYMPCCFLVEKVFDSDMGYRMGCVQAASCLLRDCSSLQDVIKACDVLLQIRGIQYVPFAEGVT